MQLQGCLMRPLSIMRIDTRKYACRQYLNCRGNAGGRVPLSRVSFPPSRFSVPPSRFRRPPIQSWSLDDQRKNSQLGLKDPANFLPKMVANCVEDLFFCGLHLSSGKNEFNVRRRPFFVFIQFWRRKYIISTKLFVKLVKAAKFYNLSTACRLTGCMLPFF